MTDFGRRVTAGLHAATHQDGGTDEINLAGLTAPLHGLTHRYTDTDTFQVGGMLGLLAHNQRTCWDYVAGKPTTFPPDLHGDEHEAGEDMEVDVDDLLGELADEQKSAWAKVSGKPAWLIGTPQSDDFSATKEPPYWRHYTNELIMNAVYWDRVVNAGFLTMYGGFQSNWSSGGNKLNFPYQVVKGDFTVETKIILPASPSANYHEAGIILMRDNSNGVKFGRAYANAQILGLNHLIDAGDNFVSISFSTDTLWLKVIRVGTAITCWHSINGTDWTQKSDPGSTLVTAAPLWIGPETLLGNATHTWFEARFEYFNFS